MQIPATTSVSIDLSAPMTSAAGAVGFLDLLHGFPRAGRLHPDHLHAAIRLHTTAVADYSGAAAPPESITTTVAGGEFDEGYPGAVFDLLIIVTEGSRTRGMVSRESGQGFRPGLAVCRVSYTPTGEGAIYGSKKHHGEGEDIDLAALKVALSSPSDEPAQFETGLLTVALRRPDALLLVSKLREVAAHYREARGAWSLAHDLSRRCFDLTARAELVKVAGVLRIPYDLHAERLSDAVRDLLDHLRLYPLPEDPRRA